MKKIVFIGLHLFFGAIIALVLFLNTQNPVFQFGEAKFETNKILAKVAPQAFGFFTLNPRFKVVQLYEYDEENDIISDFPYFPLRNPRSLFGMNCEPRIYNKELQEIALHTHIEHQLESEEGTNIRENIIKEAKNLQPTIPHPKDIEKLNGTYIVSVQDVLPYEWRKSLDQSEMEGFFYKLKIEKTQ